jgi:protein involved in polysaccharide export with SLBB domain
MNCLIAPSRFSILALALMIVLAVRGAAQRPVVPDSQSDQQQAVAPGEGSNVTAVPDQPSMSAEQIIGILQQDPLLLSSMQTALEQAQGLEPDTLTDNQIYTRIREDDAFRARVSNELRKRGYESDDFAANGQDVDAGSDSWSGLFARRNNLTNLPNNVPNNAADNPERADQGRTRNQIEMVPKKPALDEQRMQPRVPGGAVNDDAVAEPQLRHRPVPYRNLPSLKDLYSQIQPSDAKLKRFGSDMFRIGTGNVNELPIDLPVGPDYVLGSGDALVLNMWGSMAQRLNRTVDRQGEIAVPEAGTVAVAGLPIAQAQNLIQATLATQFKGEHVEISLARVRTVRVYVVGDVQRPGGYDLSSLSTPLNALYAAGGPTSKGSLRIARQYRGSQLVREIDLYEFLLNGVRSQMDRLLAGDSILVPPAGPQVSVGGAVRRPAIYELKGEENLEQVLNLAGGTLVSANLKQISVERVETHERRTMLNVQPTADAKPGSEFMSFRVQDGDKVIVAPILPYNEQLVYLDGHLYRPGKYPYHEGMTVNDLLKSYQDVMPEPSDHAEIIRLQPPDFRPETISFNLADVLTGDDPISLQPFDVVRVFSRYSIDAPRVSIRGEVLRPGTYPLSQGMTVAGLVRMAGGFKRSAFRGNADLTSYVVKDGEKVVTEHSVVALSKALDGDKTEDVALKPGDVLGIRQIAGWKDIGASVTVQGEVMFAGTYGIEEGERLSSVLRRAGGFRGEAYPAAAVLDRQQVKEIGEESRREMIRRVEETAPRLGSSLQSAQEQSTMLQAMQQQQQQVLASLRSHPASGRLVIRITSDIAKWENTPSDVEMRAGDTLVIPKRPDFVTVTGQVYSPVAITFSPSRNAGWYLERAGGATESGNKKGILILRANGSVVGKKSGPFGGSVLSTRLQPGDSIIVPEKPVGGSQAWKNVIAAAQIMSSVAITGAVAGVF